jgi:hypothetical protein
MQETTRRNITSTYEDIYAREADDLDTRHSRATPPRGRVRRLRRQPAPAETELIRRQTPATSTRRPSLRTDYRPALAATEPGEAA